MLSELSYAWIFNEYPSYQDNRRFVSQETGNLYIAKVEKSDVGNYTCVVTNTVTNQKVLGPPTPLILRNDGEFSKGFQNSVFCAHRLSLESYIIGTQSLTILITSKKNLMLLHSLPIFLKEVLSYPSNFWMCGIEDIIPTTLKCRNVKSYWR